MNVYSWGLATAKLRLNSNAVPTTEKQLGYLALG